MTSLALGLAAAFFWGLHDFVVRLVGGRADPLAMLLVSMTAGAVLMTPLALAGSGWGALDITTVAVATGSGVAFAAGTYGLYHAFTIGPVKLVAPICGAYPLISVTLSVLRGQEAGLTVWGGAIAVVGGVSIIASGDDNGEGGKRLQAILWSLVAAAAFAAAFALSQSVQSGAASFVVPWIARLGAAASVAVVVILRRTPLGPVRPIWTRVVLMGSLDTTALVLVTVAGSFAHPEYAAVTASVFGIPTILLAWRFLGEAMRPIQWVGMAVVFAGIAVLSAS
jgi:drug/metabolite transporter (DMT)-like permease